MKMTSPEETVEYPKLDRAELVDLVEKIINGAGSEKEIDYWVSVFQANIPHPVGSDLIFYSETEYNSAEEVVDIALSYKPIQL